MSPPTHSGLSAKEIRRSFEHGTFWSSASPPRDHVNAKWDRSAAHASVRARPRAQTPRNGIVDARDRENCRAWGIWHRGFRSPPLGRARRTRQGSLLERAEKQTDQHAAARAPFSHGVRRSLRRKPCADQSGEPSDRMVGGSEAPHEGSQWKRATVVEFPHCYRGARHRWTRASVLPKSRSA